MPLGSCPDDDTDLLVINTKTAIGVPELDRLPGLRLLVTTTSGHDHVDLANASARDVRVARCPVARRDAVVESSLAMGLALLRRLPALLREAEQGRWVRGDVKRSAVPLLSSLTVGVVGNGVIGSFAASRWAALGADVMVTDPLFSGLSSPTELLSQADVVTLHCSLTHSSRQILDATALAQMKEGAILVNTARGECLDLTALAADDRLGGVGLDVFAQEPCPQMAELARRDNVLLSPHSAGYHSDLGRAISSEVLAAVDSFQAGQAVPHALC